MQSKNFYKSIGLIFLLIASILTFSCQKTVGTGELQAAYKRLYDAVKSKDPEQIKKVMSKNSLAFAEFAAAQQKKTPEEVLKNGFTATTFAESMPEMRDERIKEQWGALEVYNAKDKIWEDLPFVKEDGEWKFAMGDAFKGDYQKPAPGQAFREQEEANARNPNLIPGALPNTNTSTTANMNVNANANVNTVQVEPIVPKKQKSAK
jgi:hypothetical protein